MRLNRRIRHWILLRYADYEFTARSGFKNDEALVVIRSGCLQKLLNDAKGNK